MDAVELARIIRTVHRGEAGCDGRSARLVVRTLPGQPAAPARLSRARRAVLLGATAGILIVAMVLAPADVLGYLAFALTLIAASPQVITSVRRHQAGRSAVSIPSWLMRGGSQVFWLYYGLILHNGPTALSAVVVLVSVAVVVAIESAALISARLGRDRDGPLPQVESPT